jgi:transketolase
MDRAALARLGALARTAERLCRHDRFCASALGEALFPYFGITPEKVAEAARSLL